MAIMISEVYDAFIASRASEEKARKAAEALATYENRFAKIDYDLTAIRGDINLLEWINGVSLAFTLGILFKLFQH
jgi:hypothetical protein